MSEPTSTAGVGITALLVALFGPLAGEYAAIVFAALAGGLWPLSGSKDTMTGAQGAMFLLRIVLTASVLTGIISWYVASKYGIESRSTLAPVAFGIGMIGDGWRSVARRVWAVVESRISGAPVKPADKEDGQ